MVQALNRTKPTKGDRRVRPTNRQEFQEKLDDLSAKGVSFIAALKQLYVQYGMVVDAGCGAAMVQTATPREIDRAVEELMAQLGVNMRCLQSATEELARFSPRNANVVDAAAAMAAQSQGVAQSG